MDKENLLKSLSMKINECKRCSLWKNAFHAVPGEGNPNAKVLFLGEAPGFHEDQQGRPFVGQAGKLLTSLLELIGMKRDQVFITNVIKHRPPDNRDPSQNEIGSCNIWVDSQIEIIKPTVIVTLGRYSLNKFLKGAKISNAHGKPIRLSSKVILPMYHPAAALRSEFIASQFKRDFQINEGLLKDPDNEIEKISKEADENQMSLF